MTTPTDEYGRPLATKDSVAELTERVRRLENDIDNILRLISQMGDGYRKAR